MTAKKPKNDGGNPIKPTSSIKPTNPTNPTSQTNPTSPTSPTSPTNPTNPTKPTSPTSPTNPTKPTDLLSVLVAFKKGDFDVRMPIDQTGRDGKIADTLNDIIEQSQSLAKEFERTSTMVAREGNLKQRFSAGTLPGSWGAISNHTNTIIEGLVQPTGEIMRVITAVAQGDLSMLMELETEMGPLKGTFLSSARAVNEMVTRLKSFASEVTRVARDVGTEGKLGGQADVEGVAGTWKDLTDNVNSMATNLTNQVRNIAEVTTAVATGDLTQKITVDARGEVLELKNTINRMVDQLSSFSDEVTRLAREVGTDGKLGGQAGVEGVTGTWKDLTDNVNIMAGNLTTQVRNIAEVTAAVARGDLTRKITIDAQGEVLDLKNTINQMVDQLSSFSDEVTRLAREVGTEGVLGGSADVENVTGAWKDLTDNVNAMAGNLTTQVRNIAEVTAAVANGDLTRKITVDAQGETLALKNTINEMVDQLSSFADEVTRLAREVGTEGVLGGSATVEDVAGTWKDLTDNVNIMVSNLSTQVRNIAVVTTAVARGDLTQKITIDAQGEVLELKDTINRMVDQLSSFSNEVTRLAREVGTEGVLGGKAEVEDVAGTWKDLADNVNIMASNLTTQVRNIAEVTTAVALGDLTRKITIDAQGEVLELKDTINRMVDQLSTFSGEVTRLAREVGTEGVLGGSADVEDVAGTWKALTDNVNTMANNLTSQVRAIAEVTTAVARGDLTRKVTIDAQGEVLELKSTINRMVDQLSSFSNEVTRLAREVGTEGVLGGKAEVEGVSGTWKDLTDNVNLMADNLTAQVRNIAEVTTAVARGELTQKITIDAQGEVLELKDTVNQMVDRLSSFADEVTRLAREIGTEGVLGGQAEVAGVSGSWRELTENVNLMAGNLTDQVRGVAKVVTGIANGNLKGSLTVQAKGEVGELTETINGMIDVLRVFADEVTRVAREVGVDGKLGGQARVPDAAGTWKDLVSNVNELAGNLTTQVRAIGGVASSVASGDLTKTVTTETRGEVEELKDNINGMISSLRETTRVNEEQDWLKSNLAKLGGMLQGQRDMTGVANLILSELADTVSIQHGVFYLVGTGESNEFELKLIGSYGYKERKQISNRFTLGEGLIGQAALERKSILLTDVPGEYVQISSGLGKGTPLDLMIMPVIFENEVLAVIELASFNRFSEVQRTFLEQFNETIGIVLSNITAAGRTEELLKESQTLSEELQTQQEELEQTNEELEEKAELLVQQKEQVEGKNREVELTKQTLQEKAEELELTSKYKSEFLANMSHELRTPLNSLLILSKSLSDNSAGNLSEKQVDFAQTIHSSGNELLDLINEILDLAKIESGVMPVEMVDVSFGDLRSDVERTFNQVAQDSGLGFAIELDTNLPPAVCTDPKRLQQILKNLLSNAFKFTDQGRVTLEISRAEEGWSRGHEVLDHAGGVIAFTVTDSGIGIPLDRQKVIFEAFQQIDGSTSRKYGGTGLGLSISREIARALGGEIRLSSTPGEGSTFTFYMPQSYRPSPTKGDGHQAKGARPARPARPAAAAADGLVPTVPEPESPLLAASEIPDDRDDLQPEDHVLLIVEDDTKFARILLERAREKGFKGLVATRGDAGLAMAKRYTPDAITLDIRLPEMDGWNVLDRLKHCPETRHIPVHVISVEANRERALDQGAIACLEKPVSDEALSEAFAGIHAFAERKVKSLLIAEDNETERKALIELIGKHDVDALAVGTGEEALAALKSKKFDCLVLDLGLPDMSGFELIEIAKQDPTLCQIPIIVYTGKELTGAEETQLRSAAETIVVKNVRSPERLLDETSLFLHRVQKNLPEKKQQMLQEAHQNDPALAGKKVLIVDDDVRNIFALSSMLESYKMTVVHAESGLSGIRMLEEDPDIDAVLMDVMMPEMDGYEAMRTIRAMPGFKTLPIIAVTAKAMLGDREECIEAGASDYIAKPVDTEQLLSLLRVWTYR